MTDDEPRTDATPVTPDAPASDAGTAGDSPSPYGDDGTTLTGESETSGDASKHDLVEPAGKGQSGA